MAEGETVEKPVAALVKYLNERKVHSRDKGKVCDCCTLGSGFYCGDTDLTEEIELICYCFRGNLVASRWTSLERVARRERRM